MMETGRVVLDPDGFPVLLAANVSSSGISRLAVGQKSGNPRHDVHSGKFGQGGGKKKRGNPPPANVDPHEWARMMAAARDAAREFDAPSEGDIREFLAGRARQPEAIDIPGFLVAVKQQRLADLADLLDQQFRSTGTAGLKQGRRKVRVTAPRGYLRKALRNLEGVDVQQLIDTVVSRGHSQEEVAKWFESKGIGQ